MFNIFVKEVIIGIQVVFKVLMLDEIIKGGSEYGEGV